MLPLLCRIFHGSLIFLLSVQPSQLSRVPPGARVVAATAQLQAALRQEALRPPVRASRPNVAVVDSGALQRPSSLPTPSRARIVSTNPRGAQPLRPPPSSPIASNRVGQVPSQIAQPSPTRASITRQAPGSSAALDKLFATVNGSPVPQQAANGAPHPQGGDSGLPSLPSRRGLIFARPQTQQIQRVSSVQSQQFQAKPARQPSVQSQRQQTSFQQSSSQQPQSSPFQSQRLPQQTSFQHSTHQPSFQQPSFTQQFQQASFSQQFQQPIPQPQHFTRIVSQGPTRNFGAQEEPTVTFNPLSVCANYPFCDVGNNNQFLKKHQEQEAFVRQQHLNDLATRPQTVRPFHNSQLHISTPSPVTSFDIGSVLSSASTPSPLAAQLAEHKAREAAVIFQQKHGSQANIDPKLLQHLQAEQEVIRQQQQHLG